MIVVAGGSSSRFGGEKLLAEVGGKPLIAHTVAAVTPYVDRCVLVVRSDMLLQIQHLVRDVEIVEGGPTRTASEMAGLAAVAGDEDLIGIHDGARPLISHDLIDRLYDTAIRTGAAVPVLEPAFPVVSRSELTPVPSARIVQTPQVFDGAIVMSAFVRAAQTGFDGHDTAEVVQTFAEQTIAVVQGDPDNIKVTYPADLDRVRRILEGRSRNEPE